MHDLSILKRFPPGEGRAGHDAARRAMTKGTPTIAALTRGLVILEAILADKEGRSVASIAAAIGVPVATAHRQVATLIADGLLTRLPGMQLGPGNRLLRMLQMVDEKQVIVTEAAPILHRLAAKLRCVVQLGSLESDMVTYRLKTGPGSGSLFTKVGLQLEAYCTAIGKVLLAHLPEGRREVYLASGPFPALTARTITDVAKLREELTHVVQQGFARDDEEIAEGLACLAVPIAMPDGRVLAAISASRMVDAKYGLHGMDCEHLAAAARQIEAAVAAASNRDLPQPPGS